MQDRLRSYRILCILSFACAACISYYVWKRVAIVGDPWPGVFWLAAFAVLSESLAISLDEENHARVTPTSPILWTAACVVGPFPAVLVCVISGVAAQLLACASFHTLRAIEAGREGEQQPSSPFADYLAGTLSRIAMSWESRGLALTLYNGTLYISGMVLLTSLGGLAYHVLGGKFLINGYPQGHTLREFVLPFLGLVTASILEEHALYTLVIGVLNPVPGVRGIHGILMRAKLTWLEDVLPVWQGPVFLAVVAGLLSYLYAHIGVMGFLVAIMPVVALRDFFRQWVDEKAAYVDTITTLATYMQHYHPYTRGHLKRVADLSERLARELRLRVESIRHIGNAGLLHDIGKVGVSEEILDKTEKLTDEEWGKIKEHPVKGAEIVSHIEFLEGIVDWIKYHHKWHNGAGYPAANGNGNGHNKIPIEAAIIATADAFDAMTDDRELTLEWRCDSCGYKPDGDERPEKCPGCGAEKRRTYREPKSLDDAIDELRRGAGSQFHPDVVKAFLTMVDRDGLHLV